MPLQVIYITSALLLLALFPMPYGYYTLLRIVVSGVFGWSAYITYDKDSSSSITWIYAIICILFNPIIPIELSKGIWMFIDVFVAGLLLLTRKNFIELECIRNKFNDLINTLNNAVYDGVGDLECGSNNKCSLYKDGSNKIIIFNYYMGFIKPVLDIEWRFKYYQQEAIYKKSIDDTGSISKEEQIKIANNILSEAGTVFLNHMEKITPDVVAIVKEANNISSIDGNISDNHESAAPDIITGDRSVLLGTLTVVVLLAIMLVALVYSSDRSSYDVPAPEAPATEEAAPAPEEAPATEDSSSVYKDSVAINDQPIHTSSVSLCGIKLGSISNIQENENMKILANETIEGKNYKKYQLSDGNIASITTDIQTNKIIYIENEWSYSLKANAAASGYIFGITSLDDIRNNNDSNGFAWISNVIQKSEKGALFFNAYPVTQNNNSVVVFVTEIDNPFDKSGSAKLVGIILAEENYLNEIWGNEKIYDSNVPPIVWQ